VIALWLFLYLAWLLRTLGMLTVEGRSWSTFFLLLPLLLLPISIQARKRWPRAFEGWALRIAGIAALVGALCLARLLSLDFWDTKRAGASALVALVGLGLQWVMLARPEASEGPGLWIWIAFWEYTGAWHPALPPLGAGLGACLTAFGAFAPQPAPVVPTRPMRVWPALLLLGLALPKPSWDFLLEPTWAMAFSAFAFGAAVSHLYWIQRIGSKISERYLLVALAAFFVLYPSSRSALWALLLGLFGGWIWARLPRPLPVLRLSMAFLAGLILSFALHANAGRPGLRHFVWLGGGSARVPWFN